MGVIEYLSIIYNRRFKKQQQYKIKKVVKIDGPEEIN